MKKKKVGLSKVLLFLLAAIPVVTAFGQAEMTYPRILTALKAKPPRGWTKEEVIEKIIADVKLRKVDRPLTVDLEYDLRRTGATDELIEAIRKYSWPMPGPVAPTGTTRKNSIGMELVWIPPAGFEMGWTEDAEAWSECKKSHADCTINDFPDEVPKHRVTIREGFWMGKYEVTQGQWRAAMGDNPSYFKDCGANCPVEQVSWDDIQIFLGKLNEKNDGFEYSLPTEAQWEYAARAGTTADWYGALDDIAWYSYNSGRNPFNGTDYFMKNGLDDLKKRMADNGGQTHPVGTKRPNNFGLYDMLGNVAEWCEDWFGSYSDGAATDPKGPASGDGRMVRGGSWDLPAIVARSSMRTWDKPSNRENDIGFRVVARVK